MRESINGPAMIKGRVRAYQVTDTSRRNGKDLKGHWVPRTSWSPNLILYDWATIFGKMLTTGAVNYKISGMYVEYQNVGSSGDAVTIPAYGRSDGISYYSALSSSPDRDFFRAPLVASSLLSTDMSLFPGGNSATFFAQTVAGIGTGVYGKPFNDTAISKVYGAALVAMPSLSDYTQDLVLSRFYFSAPDQQAKLATSQIGLEWALDLG